MKVAGIFSGIGGLELGLHQAGAISVLLCENDPAARSVLVNRFPGVNLVGDVRSLESLPTDVELLAGGFPCQDLSPAGKTAGIGGSRSGLIEEVFRIVERSRVPSVLLENVPFMLSLDSGRAMRLITERFDELGYRWAYRVIDSRSFGLPQRRQRVFILASTSVDPAAVLFREDAGDQQQPSCSGHDCGFYWTEGLRGLGWAVNAVPTLKGGSSIGIPSPPAIWLRPDQIVTPHIRDAERLQGFPAGWTDVPAATATRGARWKMVGNAVSVPVAAWVGDGMRCPFPRRPLETKSLVGTWKWPAAAMSTDHGPVAVGSSPFPRPAVLPILREWLEHGSAPLSDRALRGFADRLSRGSLRLDSEFRHVIEALAKRQIRDCAKELPLYRGVA